MRPLNRPGKEGDGEIFRCCRRKVSRLEMNERAKLTGAQTTGEQRRHISARSSGLGGKPVRRSARSPAASRQLAHCMAVASASIALRLVPEIHSIASS